MSNPLSMFRRYQKVLLAVFGVLIIFIFTVGTIITEYQSQNIMGGGENAVVVTWKKGKITEEDIYAMRTSHNLAVRFLDTLVERAVKAGGSPKGPGVTRDQQGQIRDPGIPRGYADEDLVRTMLLAEKAREMGVVVSDDAILDFLDALGDDEIPRNEYPSILREATGGRFVRAQLFDQLRTELLAQQMRIMASGGLLAMTPSTAWDYFARLNRRVTAELVPVAVEDFVAEVKQNPTDAEVRDLYTEAKDRFADPNSPEPGFKRRRQIAFQYLKADFNEFLETEMAALSDDEVQAYYDEHLEDFKAAELPSIDDETDTEPAATKPDTEPAAKESVGGEKEADVKEAGKDKAGEPKEPESKDAAAEKTPSTEPKEAAPPKDASPTSSDAESKPDAKPAPSQPETKPEDDAKADEKPAEKATEQDEAAPADEPDDPDAAKPDADPADGKQPEDTGAGDSSDSPSADQSNRRQIGEVTLVSFQTDAEDKPPVDAPKPQPEEEPAEKPSDESAATEKAAKTEEKDGDSKDTAPKDTAPTSAADAAAGESSKPETKSEPAPKYKPLAEVEDEIRRTLARPKAQEKVNAALEEAKKTIESYFRERVKWEALQKAGREAEEPAPLDLEKLATQSKLVLGDIPLVDGIGVQDYELGKTYQFSFFNRQIQQIPFPQIAYQDGVPLYQPQEIRSFETDTTFLFWKIDEKEPFVPELKEIRDEVVAEWKLQQARKLAKAKAAELADSAAKDKPLAESLPEPHAEKAFETSEFSWMTRGATPMMGTGLPSLSQVAGVEAAGAKFMRSVFSLQVGETGVAVNAPESVVYVVRIVDQTPDNETLRKRFIETGITPETFFMASAERQQVLTDWFNDVEREMRVTWIRDPDQATAL